MEIFIKRITTVYNLDHTKILDDWKIFNEHYNDLNKMKKSELILEATKLKFQIGSTKIELINNILNEIKEPIKVDLFTKKTIIQNPIILNKIAKSRPHFAIKKNMYGNFEHLDSGMVFCTITSKVIGKQQNTGIISQLSKIDIEICKQFGFEFDLPTNLNDSNQTVDEQDENLNDLNDILENEEDEEEGEDEESDD